MRTRSGHRRFRAPDPHFDRSIAGKSKTLRAPSRPVVRLAQRTIGGMPARGGPSADQVRSCPGTARRVFPAAERAVPWGNEQAFPGECRFLRKTSLDRSSPQIRYARRRSGLRSPTKCWRGGKTMPSLFSWKTSLDRSSPQIRYARRRSGPRLPTTGWRGGEKKFTADPSDSPAFGPPPAGKVLARR